MHGAELTVGATLTHLIVAQPLWRSVLAAVLTGHLISVGGGFRLKDGAIGTSDPGFGLSAANGSAA